ncbi:MAG TPA: phosphocarrier protein HPr [Firmicutes bacterium]|jgi:phosphocarrier protein HPr|nr:phosphocarrier protein HPr [Bacillota bacterium]
MYAESIEIQNKSGLHARPATTFIKAAQKFKSDITIEKDSKQANAKSIVSLLSLGASKGSIVKITATGEDEIQAINTLIELIKSKFGEE